MSTYSQCEAQARLIGQEFHNRIKKDNTQQQNFFLEYPDLQALNIQAPILILGLNPSGEDDRKVGRQLSNLFSYIPQNPDIAEQNVCVEYDDLQKFTYVPYFKVFVECFQQLKPAYNPLWYNQGVLLDICSTHSKHFNIKHESFLNSYTKHDNGNYIVFADLIQYSKTNSKLIVEHLYDSTIAKLLETYIRMMLDFIKPKLVLSANASVSHFLVNIFNEGVTSTHFDLEGTEVFLGSMLSGQRAMDVFSRQRLMNEIQNYLANN